jgi:hypothetical protein
MAGDEEIDIDKLMKDKERLAAARGEAEKRITAMQQESQEVDAKLKEHEKLQQDMDGAFKELAKNSKDMD